MIHITDFYTTLVTLGRGSLEQELPLDSYNMAAVIFEAGKSQRDEIIFEVSGSVRLPTIRQGNYKLIGEELYNIVEDPGEENDLPIASPEIVETLKRRIEEIGKERPPMPNMSLLMTPALPWIYGQQENAIAPEWVKDLVTQVRATQPQEWTAGETPWPQAAKDGKIIYTGDGR